jgi:hypothetical protein
VETKIEINPLKRGSMPFIRYQDTNALNVEKYSIPTQVMEFRLQSPEVQGLILLKNSQLAIRFLTSDLGLRVLMKYYFTGEWSN